MKLWDPPLPDQPEHRDVMLALVNVVLSAVAARVAEPLGGPLALIESGGQLGVAVTWGGSRRTDPATAALVNGAAAHAWAFDDTADVLLAHPTVTLAPAVLAATPEHCSGELYREAYRAGYATMVRLAQRMNPEHYLRGFHATSTLGAVGAAVAAATVQGLKPADVERCARLATSLAGGIRENVNSPMRPWHAGIAAANALLALRLHRAGVEASPTAVTGRTGLLAAFGGRSPHAPPAGGSTTLNFKSFPACGAVAPGVTALGQALADLAVVRTGDVATITAVVQPLVVDVCPFERPADVAQAQMSLTFALAARLLHGRLDADLYTERVVGDPALAAELEKVTVRDAALDGSKFETEITVRTSQGATATRRVPGVGGRPVHEHDVREIARRWNVVLDTDEATLLRAAEGVTACAGDDLHAALERLCASATPDHQPTGKGSR